MVFKSSKQRRAFFAKASSRSSQTPLVVFSYRTPNKKLGSFKNLKDAFTQFPSEKKAFLRVKKFRRATGIQVNTIAEIKAIKRKQNGIQIR